MNTKQITAANVDELMEQREQSQACLGYAESRQNEQIPWKELMHVQMTVQGLGFKQSSDTFIPGSESEHRWQDEHPDGTFINK